MQATAADDILLGLGYEPVDIESYTGYIRALKETIINLTNKNPNCLLYTSPSPRD